MKLHFLCVCESETIKLLCELAGFLNAPGGEHVYIYSTKKRKQRKVAIIDTKKTLKKKENMSPGCFNLAWQTHHGSLNKILIISILINN